MILPSESRLMPCYELLEGRPRIVRANGSYIFSESGRMLDLASGYWSVPLGHNNPLVQACGKPFFADVSTAESNPAELLAEQLCHRLGYAKTILLTSGSSAVDCALRIALQVTAQGRVRKDTFVSLKGCFHGSTALGLAVAGSGFDHWLPNQFIKVKKPGRWVFSKTLAEGEANQAASYDLGELTDIAAMIFEPILGAGGVHEFNPVAYEALAQQCHSVGGLVIADEVATGIGRAGFLARSEMYETKPDVVVLGKGLTNGLAAVSAVLLSKDVADRIELSTKHDSVKWLWGETYGGSVSSACEAASNVLTYLNEGRLSRIRGRGTELGLELLRQIPIGGVVVDVRTPSHASMFAVEFRSKKLADQVRSELAAKGIRVINEGPSVVLMPMLTTRRNQIASAFDEMRIVVEHLGA